MKIKKLLALLMSLTMVISVTACGDSTDTQSDDKSNDKNTVSEADADTADDADTAQEEEKEPVTLTVTTWREVDSAYYEEIINRFQEAYDWITVDMVFNSDESSYNTNLQADIGSGTAPDVFDLHTNSTMRTYAQEGVILSQQDMEYMENYSDAAKVICTFDGENYAYINGYNYFGFLYNIDIFEEVGVEIPTTPDEMVDVVNKLKEAGYGGAVYAGSAYGYNMVRYFAPVIAMGAENFANMMMGLDDGSIVDFREIEGLKEGIEAVELYTQENIWYDAYADIGYEAGISLFASGQSAILYTGTYLYGEKATSFPDVNAGFFPIPTYAENGVTYAESAQATCINAASENIEAAKLWVNFLASAEISEYYCTNAKMMSPIEGVEPQFEEAEMLLASSTGYELLPVLVYENEDYWMTNWKDMLKAIMWNGEDFETLAADMVAFLEDLDLAK
ncbi:MAG: extracellular solute-binding protein [Roseburia sp.]|nr:extracellular solute-binding protein [Roseburia sp.]